MAEFELPEPESVAINLACDEADRALSDLDALNEHRAELEAARQAVISALGAAYDSWMPSDWDAVRERFFELRALGGAPPTVVGVDGDDLLLSDGTTRSRRA